MRKLTALFVASTLALGARLTWPMPQTPLPQHRLTRSR